MENGLKTSNQIDDLKKSEVVQEEKMGPIKQPEQQKVRSNSYFDGGVLALIGWRILAFLVTVLTLGLGAPWAKCMLYSYQVKHTVYSGKRLKFVGTGGSLFLNTLKWILLSIITLGIYSLVVPVRKARWVISNIHYEDEGIVKGQSSFDGHTIQLIGLNLLSYILVLISFGLLYPFTVCLRIKWINKHTTIDNKKLVFTGKAIALWGKYILWGFLTLITFGIFSLWLPIKELKWQSKNIHIKADGEKEPKKDWSFLIIIPIAIIVMGLGSYLLMFSKAKNIQLWQVDSEYSIQKVVDSYIVAPIKRKIYKEILNKAEKGQITQDRKNELINKYDLHEIEQIYGNDIEAINRDNNIANIIKSIEEQKNKKENVIYELHEDVNLPISTNHDNISKDIPAEQEKNIEEKKKSINIAGYTISFGTYTGEDTLFDWEEQKEIKTNIRVLLEDKYVTIDGERVKYSVAGNQIIVRGFAMFEATGNNKLRYLAQSCPTLTYQGM